MDLSVSEARDTLSELVNRVAYQGERVVLRRHGKAVAVLVSPTDLSRLAELDRGSSRSKAQRQPERLRANRGRKAR